MRYHILACDYDGTLAHNGRVNEKTVAALERIRNSGRRLVMVTGRELDELQEIFPQLELFDRVVAENGALIYVPSTREEKTLGERPPEDFIKALVARGVEPISVGRVIVATWEPHELAVVETIREFGLELQVIFNKGALMVLPTGINKATGLSAALTELHLSPHNAVGVGDAENDHAFLSACECGVAVANALDSLKGRADWVTVGDHGDGVIELIDQMIADDLKVVEARLGRHTVTLGTREDGREMVARPHSSSILVAGTSGGGKSTLATGFLERLAAKGYQFCIIDPEGDYSTFEGAVTLGDQHRPPSVDEVLQLLEKPSQNVVVNLVGLSLEHRPGFFEKLLPHLQELRAKFGRPHWIVVDETHHLFPSSWDPAALTLPREMYGLLLITVHPNHVARPVLASVGTIMAIGKSADETLRLFSKALGRSAPDIGPTNLEPGEALLWSRDSDEPPVKLLTEGPKAERRRHRRKYAEGELAEELCFYFRGPDNRLNLRAQNLMIFLQMADGVDDETWTHHLMSGEYAEWFRNVIKDEELASVAAELQKSSEKTAAETREAIRAAINERYTAPT